MKIKPYQRILIIFLVILLLSSLTLYVVRQIYDLAIDFQQNIWLLLPFTVIFLVLVFVLYRFLGKKDKNEQTIEINQKNLLNNLEKAESLGVDMDEIRKTMSEVEKRRELKQISLAVFGQVNTGKSSLIQSLTKNAEIISAPTSGTTKEITRYKWKNSENYEVILSDVPGRAEPSADERGQMAFDEAMLADLIVYITESDLTREQLKDLEALAEAHKPILLALNKTDQLSDNEKEELVRAISNKCGNLVKPENIVLTSARNRYLVQMEDTDGSVKEEWREKSADLKTFATRVIEILDDDGLSMIALADTVLLGYLHQKVKKKVESARQKEAMRIIGSYSRASVITAMAAVVPGIEIVILSGVGYKMVSQLNELFGAPASANTLETLLRAAARQFSDISKLSLVIGGNVAKSFPGLGTVIGGMIHALAYGLIVRGIGLALLELLQESEQLSEKAFEKKLENYVLNGLPSKEEIYDLVSVIRAFKDKENK